MTFSSLNTCGRKENLTWDTLRNPGPGSILAHWGGVMGLLELGEAAHVDGVSVGNTGPGGTVSHEPVRYVRNNTRS